MGIVCGIAGFLAWLWVINLLGITSWVGSWGQGAILLVGIVIGVAIARALGSIDIYGTGNGNGPVDKR